MITWELIWGIVLLVGTLIAFISEKWPVDVTAVGLLTALVVTSLFFPLANWPSLNDLLSVFSSPAPLSIAALFVVSAALERCGVVNRLSYWFSKGALWPYPIFLGIFLLGVTLLSAFINNTIVVIVLMPVILSISRISHRSPAKYLIPLSYASIFGGCCTLMGTSTNILASDILNTNGYGYIKMFEFLWIGGPAGLLSCLYLVLFADRLLPHTGHVQAEKLNNQALYLNKITIPVTSHYIGCAIHDLSIFNDFNSKIVAIERKGHLLNLEDPLLRLEADDTLSVMCSAEMYLKYYWMDGLEVAVLQGMDLSLIASKDGTVVEGIVGPRSNLVGKSLQALNQQPFYRLYFLGIRSADNHSSIKKPTDTIHFGDILLMIGTPMALDNLDRSGDVHLLNRHPLPSDNMSLKEPILLSLLFGMVLLAAFDLFPVVGVLLMTAALLILLKIIPIKEAYASLDGRILSCLYAMMALGITMEKIGLVNRLAMTVVHLLDGPLSLYLPYYLLAFIYGITMLLTEILSNNATVLLMAPLAIKVAEMVHVSPKPFVIAACIASSAGFMIPTGYQTHTYVYGAGHYRFVDFIKIGWPLNVIYALVTLGLAPLIWPF